MSLAAKRNEILKRLSEKITPIQFSKLKALLDLQERIWESTLDRNKELRRLRTFIEVGEYRKVCLLLDLVEEDVYSSRNHNSENLFDYLSILENRALVNCQTDESWNWSKWLEPKEMLQLMELQNEESRSFEVPLVWSLEEIQEFELKHNL